VSVQESRYRASLFYILQLESLAFQGRELASIESLHAAKRRLQFVKRRFRYCVPAADIGRCQADFPFFLFDQSEGNGSAIFPAG
jgi:hypothetical protein